MGISDATKPWAVIMCSLEGSAGDHDVPFNMEYLFRPLSKGLRDYWLDQTLGEVDIANAEYFGWYQCDWTVLGTPGVPEYMGIHRAPDRSEWHDHAVGLLTAHEPGIDLGRFRGVLSVFNFAVGGGATGTNVVYGLNGVGSAGLSWAEGGWRRCNRCSGMIQNTSPILPCIVQNTPGVQETHNFDGSHDYLIPTDTRLVNSQKDFHSCTKCGGLYIGDPVGCPVAGKHKPAPQKTYSAMHWKSAIGEADWWACTSCGLVVKKPADWNSLLCPATGKAHTPWGAELNFCETDYSYNRTFLMHEMGHTYGFHHGRNSRPDSTDLGGECAPGGYGDRYDVMSAMNCASYYPPTNDPEYRFGPRGPGLSVHHMTQKDLIPVASIREISTPTTHPELILLHPTIRPDLNGYAALRIGSLLVEFRHKGRWIPRPMDPMHRKDLVTDGWDASLEVGDSPGCVLVYETAGASPVLLMGTNGHEGLVADDRFESRVGLGDVSIFVRSIDGSGEHAEIEVDIRPIQVSGWQRWLVLPCLYPDEPVPTKTVKDITAIFQAGETFWQDMANGSFPTGGGSVLSGLGSIDGAWISMQTPWATEQNEPPDDRVRRSIDETLALKRPKSDKLPFYLDWRYFTGIIILRNVDLGSGWHGELGLPSGNWLKSLPDCPNDTHTEDSAGPLPFRVIEVGQDSISQAGLARAIGRSLSLADSNDYFDLMGRGTYRYTPPASGAKIGVPVWGPTGPGLSTETLKQMNWLDDDRTFVATVPQGQNWVHGSVSLTPVTHASDRSGYVRAEIGPFAFEVRTNDRWDSGLPDEAAVLLHDPIHGDRKMLQGEAVSTGSLLRRIAGGTDVTVVALSSAGAGLEFTIQEGTEIMAGGGALRGGGTVLFTNDGRIIHLPPGDPWEREVTIALEAVDEVTRRVERELPPEER
jgi:hypothetical protein